MASIFERFKSTFAPKKLSESTSIIDMPEKVKVHYIPQGSSGTEIYSGYYNEEYLSTLSNSQAADIWDKMRRSDPKIKMILSAAKNPIKGAHWFVDPSDDSEEAKRIAKLIERILFVDPGQSWSQTLSEILTLVDFGHSVFEITNKVVIGDPEFGSYNSIGGFGFRSQRTIEKWNLDHKTGKLCSISQYAYGDLQRLVDIDAKNLLVFTFEKEGDNYEGISALRPCYGPWMRKNVYLKLMAVGIEKFAVLTPTMTVPLGKENSPEYAIAQQVLEKYVTHQQQYITLPEGWDIKLTENNFDASKVLVAVEHENREMVHAFMANFLELGSSGSGSYALSYDLSDFFLTGIEHIANYICDTINGQLIPKLIALNFGPNVKCPKLNYGGITDKPGKELAEILKTLADAKVIVPDDKLEEQIRTRYGLPASSAEGQRELPKPFTPFSEKTQAVKFADKPKSPYALMKAEAPALAELIRQNIRPIGQKIIKELTSKWERGSASERAKAGTMIQPVGYQLFSDSVLEFLTQASAKAIAQGKKEVPGSKDVKFSDTYMSMKLSVRTSRDFKALPKAVQDRLLVLSDLLPTGYIGDLVKALSFQYTSSQASTDSLKQLTADLTEALDKVENGASVEVGAMNAIATTVNESRNALFLEPEVMEQIESFTFENPDPVSPICQDLVGRTFSKDDPDFDRYAPPLHHNCKSYISVNLVGTTKKVDDIGIKPSDPKLEKFITLSDSKKRIVPRETLRLSEQGPGFYAVEVSKKHAMSEADAKVLANEFADQFMGVEENESIYRFTIHSLDAFVQGTLRSFEPLEGVTVWYGKIKPTEEVTPDNVVQQSPAQVQATEGPKPVSAPKMKSSAIIFNRKN